MSWKSAVVIPKLGSSALLQMPQATPVSMLSLAETPQELCALCLSDVAERLKHKNWCFQAKQ